MNRLTMSRPASAAAAKSVDSWFQMALLTYNTSSTDGGRHRAGIVVVLAHWVAVIDG